MIKLTKLNMESNFKKEQILGSDLKSLDKSEVNFKTEKESALESDGIILSNDSVRDVLIEKLYQYRKKEEKRDEVMGGAIISSVFDFYAPEVLEIILKFGTKKVVTLKDLNPPAELEKVFEEIFTFFKDYVESNYKQEVSDDIDMELVKNIRDKIKMVTGFEELYKFLRKLVEIPGVKKTYSCDELIDIINKVRNDDSRIREIPKTYGLRLKVGELLD